MKKILLGTSALALASLMATSAGAAEAPSMQISGNLDYFVRATSAKQDTGASIVSGKGGKGVEISSFTGTSELKFSGSGSTDDGLTYGAKFEIRPTNDGALDEAALTFGGNWGSLMIGDDEGPDTIYGFFALPLGNWDASGAWFSGAAGTQGALGYVPGTGDASKIMYTTPNMSGVNASIAFTPDGDSTFGGSNSDNGSGYHNVIQTAINFSRDFGGVSFAASAAHMSGTADNTLGVDNNNASGWGVGTKVSSQGFTLAMGYNNRGDGGCVKGGSNCSNGSSFDVGASYSIEKLTLGVGYAKGSANQGDTGTGDIMEDEASAFSVEASYGLADGLTTYAGVQRIEVQEKDNNHNGETTSVVVGTRISF